VNETIAPRWRTLATRVLVAALIVIALLLLGRRLGGSVAPFVQAVDRLGPAGPIAFMIGYAIACIALIPASLLTLAAGAIFGVLWGTVYTLVGAVVGATAAFLIARYAARGLVVRRLADNPRFAAIDRAVGAEGLKIVTLLRLSPVVPFSLLNYALGLTHVSLADYLIGMIGIVPGTLLYVYYGKVGGDLAALAGGAHPSGGTASTALLILGLVATIAVTILIGRIARRALAHVI
jgi:uncharacterized membrane protein YdjX (TVP38/TMEM64 family)